MDWRIIRRLYGFAKPYKTQFWFLVFLILCQAGASPMIPLLIRYTLDHYVSFAYYQDLIRMLASCIACWASTIRSVSPES